MSTAESVGPAPTRQPAGAFHNGALSRFNAWFFTVFDRYINHIARAHKSAAFEGIRPGAVLEIGAGVGANVGYLPEGAQLVALEPNLAMHDGLRRRCADAGVPLTVLAGRAEEIPLPDDSVDEVICSLVLCTVDDPERVLAEIRRVLRPGGKFRFVEHVAERDRHPRRWVQHLVRRPWSWLFEGCRLHRNTHDTVQRAGFVEVDLRHRRLRRSVFYPVNSAIWGVATA